jgi:glutathione S-transferase
MITVHHLENSRSQRVLWLLEELGLPYEVKRYERDKQTLLAPPELFKVHPLGKSPVITDGALTVAESGAIIEYLIDRHAAGALRPQAGTPEQLHYTYWLHYAEGSLMPLLVMTLVFRRIPLSPMPFFVKPIAKVLCQKVAATFLKPQIDRNLAFVEQHLKQSEWFAGASFSAADVQMSFPIEAGLSRGAQPGQYPKIEAWLKRIQARDAYKRALERGGPYELL